MNKFAKQQVIQDLWGVETHVPDGTTAVVVGGGIGGLAAATILAERGVSVVVVEREEYLGGRAGAWTDRLASGETFDMERGFHAFFRQYYNLRGWIRRIDPHLRNLTPLDDYPVLGPNGAAESFSSLPKRAPLNVIELVRRSPHLGLMDMPRVNAWAAMEMVSYERERTYRKFDDVTARAYLDSLRFPDDARRMLFNVFAHSFFNPEEGMSAGDLLMMFHFYFMGNPEGLIFDVLNEPFSVGLWSPFRRYLEDRGVRFVLGQAVSHLTRRPGHDRGWNVVLANDSETIAGDVAVLAVDVGPLKSIVGLSPDLSDPTWRESVDGLGVTLPFAVWRLWLDRPALPDRHPFAGTAGLGWLDNISLYELFEGESRRWALSHGGSVVELHAYAVPEDATEESIRDDLWTNAVKAYPELEGVGVIEDRYLVRRDCPAFRPGSNRTRPGVRTPMDDVALAGDFVSLPFPSALMERAAASGILAANQLLSRWGIRPEPVWSVPAEGMLGRFVRRRGR